MKSFCFTGHRPDKINKNYPKDMRWSNATDEVKRVKAWMEKQVTRIIRKYPDEDIVFICGGALGVDSWALEIVHFVRCELSVQHRVKIHLYLPCVEHYAKWNPHDIERSKNHINNIADEVRYVYADRYKGAWQLQRRNEAMVDNAEGVIAVWDAVESGGTWNCIDYAIKKDVPILGYNPEKDKKFVIK